MTSSCTGHPLIGEAARDAEGESWVIFDNTALGHAAANALRLAELLKAGE